MPTAKKSPKLNISFERQQLIPAQFCNLAAVNVDKEGDEVVIDFIYVDKRIKSDKDENPAQFLAKIAMTKVHAIKFNEVLTKVLAEKKK